MNIQNKIDKLITQANEQFSQENNVVEALTNYSRAYELFNYLDRKYKIQIHEILVRIAICWDVLGDYHLALENLNKALLIVKNIPCLIIYKSILEFSLKMIDDAFDSLYIFQKISHLNQLNYLYYLLDIIFLYINSHEKKRENILNKISNYFLEFPQNTVLLYIRSQVYLEISNDYKKKNNKKESEKYFNKYENDISLSNNIDLKDTKCLLKEGIKRENLSKLFFMILPEMDYYQPKQLINYSSFINGFKEFYIILRAVNKFKRKKNVFTFNKNPNISIKNYDLNIETSMNYFLRNKYYSSFNLSNNLLNPNNENDTLELSSISIVPTRERNNFMDISLNNDLSIFSHSNVKCFPSSAIITKQKNSKNTSKDKNYYNAKNKKTLSPEQNLLKNNFQIKTFKPKTKEFFFKNINKKKTNLINKNGKYNDNLSYD